MKQDTKEKLMVGGVVLAGLYILSRDSDDTTGGFGGGGGIPLLPGDTAGAAEGDTIINYILPEPIEEMPIWDMEEPVTKKMTYAPSIIPTYPLEYYTSGGVSELSVAATPAQKTKSVMELQHYGDPFAYLFSGRRDAPADVSGMVESKKDAVIAQTPVDKPVQWGEASVGGFFDFLYPITQVGKGARGRDIAIEPTKDIRGVVESKKIVEARSVSTILSKPKFVGGGSGRDYTIGGSKYIKGSSGTFYRKIKSKVTLQRGQVKGTKKSAPGSPD